MSLDETIKYYEEEAKRIREHCESVKKYFTDDSKYNAYAEGCLNLIERHEQLAEWLKELQQFRKYKKWLFEEQYGRKDSLFGDGVRYCAARLERQFMPTEKLEECPCKICDTRTADCDCEKYDKWYRDAYGDKS